MKLSLILLAAAVAVSIHANANTASNATCAHSVKGSWTKSADIGKVDMIMGKGSQPAPKQPATATPKTTR